ncbi:MAG: hypothetical protein KZQ83_16140 [gamma proteobacterium symbiont of Taylorina sp.]|nr:hypothetical protein [gamma proteobacterium symbiont of Taylorina sp.]
MKVLSLMIILLFCPILLLGGEVDEGLATTSDVYAQVMQIEKELFIIRNFFGISQKAEFREIRKAQLKPRHVWQKTYEIIVKINILRRINSLPIIEPVNMEPVLNMDPILVYEQTQRILTELRIVRFRLGIEGEISSLEKFSNKQPMDVYNKLKEVSALLDVINGSEFTPSYVFGEAMRIYEDVNTILSKLLIRDLTIPPEKLLKVTPGDTQLTALFLLGKLSELEQGIGIEGVDASVFFQDEPNPADVFELTQVILAELQVIKATLGIRHVITQAAQYYTQKTPADANQLLGWSLLKINQIVTLR